MPSNFRYDISFLRAVSVLSVLLFHYQFSFLKGGFIGVDIFFVISGYLMTKIILEGFEKDNFSILTFYQRRLQRIFPALLFMLFFFLVTVYIILPTQIINYLKSAYSSSLFFSNVFYYLNTGYFDQASKHNILLHTWSLSVEWQFYLVLPILLLSLKFYYKNNLSQFKSIFIGVTILSFLAMLIHNQYDTSYSFYIFYTRAWEMMFGGLAFLFKNEFEKIATKLKYFLLAISFTIILFFLTKTVPADWPTSTSLFPVVSVFTILAMNFEFKLYRNKIIKYLGDISYSLYLYHWPMYVIGLFLTLNDQFRYRLIFILISIILAVFSYHFIEKRNFKNNTRSILIASLLLFSTTFLLARIQPKFFLQDAAVFADVAGNYKESEVAKRQFNLDTKHYSGKKNFDAFDLNFLTIPNNQRKTIVLLGDSHAGMFAETLQNIALENNYNLIQITADGTYPEASKNNLTEMQKYFNYIFSTYFPQNSAKINLVVLSANYRDHLKNGVFQKITGSQQYFNKYKIPTIFLGQTPTYLVDFPTFQFVKTKYGKVSPKWQYSESVNVNLNYKLKNLIKSKYVDIYSLNGNLNLYNYPYIHDENHLTYRGAEKYRIKIERAIQENLSKTTNAK